MKTLLILVLSIITGSVFGQEQLYLKTKYRIHTEKLFLDKVESKKLKSLRIKRSRLKKEGPNSKDSMALLSEQIENIKRGNRIGIRVADSPDSKNYGALNDGKMRYGSLKFKDEKLFVNFFLNEDDELIDRNKTYYYSLKNRQTIYFGHNDIALSALTIPLKYRFAGENSDTDIKFEEEFSSGFNANLFLSVAFRGRTKFTYLKNLDNSIRDISWRFGVFAGIGTHTLNNSNTSSAGEDREIIAGSEESRGLFSTGLGLSYSYRTFSIGLFGGLDYSMGRGSGIWDYDGKPWIGLALGLEILKFPSFGDE